MGSVFRGGSAATPAADQQTAAKRESSERAVRITQQFRERHNMTYEFDCCGIPLVLRIFFPANEAAVPMWRIEARAGLAPAVSVASASANSRARALQDIAQDWRDTMPAAVSNLDWPGVVQAMTSVRAI